jgi:hypothetical protein
MWSFLMPKTKTIAALVDDCAKLLQKIVRMKAALQQPDGIIQCVTCGKWGHWKEMHGGHFIARTYRQHKLLEENIHPQCPGCNTFRPERVADDYNKFMRDTYGHEFVDHLTQTKRHPKKYARQELEELLAELKAQAKSLERECDAQ